MRPDPHQFTIERKRARFTVTGETVERVVSMTDMDSAGGLERLQRQPKRLGVFQALEREGVRRGSRVRIGSYELTWEGRLEPGLAKPDEQTAPGSRRRTDQGTRASRARRRQDVRSAWHQNVLVRWEDSSGGKLVILTSRKKPKTSETYDMTSNERRLPKFSCRATTLNRSRSNRCLQLVQRWVLSNSGTDVPGYSPCSCVWVPLAFSKELVDELSIYVEIIVPSVGSTFAASSSTTSSTKIGASVLTASPMASLGRASISRRSPSAFGYLFERKRHHPKAR